MSSNQRNSARLRGPGDDSLKVTVRIGNRDIPVRIADQSAGGYGMILAGKYDIPLGTKLLVQANGDWCEVRIRRVEHQLGETHLGVERVQDFVRPEDVKALRPSLRSYFPRLPAAVIGSMGLAGFVMALLFGASIWTGKSVILAGRFSVPTLSGSGGNSANSLIPFPRSSASEKKSPARPVATLKPVSATTNFSGVARSLFGFHFELRSGRERLALAKLEFVVAASDVSIVKDLDLTPDQQVVIARLLAAGQEKLAAMRSQTTLSDESLDTIQKLHDAVRSVLSERQFRQLETRLQATR